MPDPNSGCWLWTGTLAGGGYGSMRVGNTKIGRSKVQAHRFSYLLHKGKIPGDLPLDHLCRVRSCCNPDHLEPVTIRENILRGVSLSAKRAKQTHCKNGHPFTEENTRKSQKGERVCKTCNREWYRLRYARERKRPRVYLAPTHCRRGHEFTPENSWITPQGTEDAGRATTLNLGTLGRGAGLLQTKNHPADALPIAG